MSANLPRLGLGIGWRPEIALAIERRPDLGFVELLAEEFPAAAPLPAPIERLLERGVAVVPHGVSLSLGGAEPLDPRRLDALARLAERVRAPLVSEHMAFVRGGGREAGHLLPLARTPEALELLVANVRQAQAVLPVPLALENVASLFEWPHPQLDEAEFLAAVVEATGAPLLVDVENIYANARNFAYDPLALVARLPLDHVAYVHVAGGVEREGLYHDTHAHPVPTAVLDLLAELCARADVPGFLLERDDGFPTDAQLHAELDAIAASAARGAARRSSGQGNSPESTWSRGTGPAARRSRHVPLS